MNIFQSYKLQIKSLMVFAAFCFFLLLAPVNQVFAVTTITTDPIGSAASAVPVNQVLKVTFSVPVTGLIGDGGNLDMSKISIHKGTANPLAISDIVPYTNFFLSDDKKYITFAPPDMFEDDTDYLLWIQPEVIVGETPDEIIVGFHTAYNMQTLIDDDALNSLIQNNSPRTLKVIVPKKYMTKFDIATATINGNTLANVDIKAETEVAKITVSIDGGLTKSDVLLLGSVWNAGFSSSSMLDDDIIFEASDKYGRVLETRVILFNPLGYKLDLSSYKSLSVQKTLYDLILNDGKLFKAILGVYSIEELSIGKMN